MDELRELYSYIENNNKIFENQKKLILEKISELASQKGMFPDPESLMKNKLPDRIEVINGIQYAIYKSAV